MFVRYQILLLLLAAGVSGMYGADAPAPREPANWVFDLLPKSLQRNPRLDLTIITEVTAEGKKLPLVSSEHPSYYAMQSGGYRKTKDAPAGGVTVPPDAMDAFVRRSLATRGYYPSSDRTPATLVLVYFWGMHARIRQDGTATGNEVALNLIDRAGLVGGKKFQDKFSELLGAASAQVDAARGSPTRHMAVDGVAVEPVLGSEQLDFMNPITRFRESSIKNEFLLEQVGGDVYYVLISAYEAGALAKNRAVLLWRTRMTVSADGVSQADSLPTLISAAAPYLGRDMDEPATLTPRAHNEGRVRLGPLIWEEGGSSPSAPPDNAKKPE